MDRSTAGRIGALARLAQYDPKVLTEKARAAFVTNRFENEVDPDRTLEPAERTRRAAAARRAHMLRLAARSAEVRASKKGRPEPNVVASQG